MSRDTSTLIRAYEYEDQVLFVENANSPVGRPMGVIIQTDEEEWSFFMDRHRGYTLHQLQEVCNKITTLNANSHAERQQQQQPATGLDATPDTDI